MKSFINLENAAFIYLVIAYLITFLLWLAGISFDIILIIQLVFGIVSFFYIVYMIVKRRNRDDDNGGRRLYIAPFSR